MKLIQNSTLKIIVTFIALFFASPVFAETQEVPQTEDQKIVYLGQYLPNAQTFKENPMQPTDCEIFTYTTFACLRLFVPAFTTAIILDSKHTFDPVLKKLLIMYSPIILNGCDGILSTLIQKKLIANEQFRSISAGFFGTFIGSTIWGLFYPLYYNYLLEKILNDFEEHPERFPQAAHPILNNAIQNFDNLNSKEKTNIYIKLMEITKPYIEAIEKKRKLLADLQAADPEAFAKDQKVRAQAEDARKKEAGRKKYIELKKTYDQLYIDPA